MRFEDPEASQLDGLSGNQVFEHLVKVARESLRRADLLESASMEKLSDLYGSGSPEKQAAKVADRTKLEELANWMRERLNWLGQVEELANQDRSSLERTLRTAIEDRFFPEIRRMERTVLLRILDDSWMGHLLAMDHLRSAVSFRGMAQMDPKVEYKREGMKLFEQMWFAIGERMTDIIFRMEALDDGLVESSFVETQAQHAAPAAIADLQGIVDERQKAVMAASDAAGTDGKVRAEPIRRQAGPRRPQRSLHLRFRQEVQELLLPSSNLTIPSWWQRFFPDLDTPIAISSGDQVPGVVDANRSRSFLLVWCEAGDALHGLSINDGCQ